MRPLSPVAQSVEAARTPPRAAQPLRPTRPVRASTSASTDSARTDRSWPPRHPHAGSSPAQAVSAQREVPRPTRTIRLHSPAAAAGIPHQLRESDPAATDSGRTGPDLRSGWDRPGGRLRRKRLHESGSVALDPAGLEPLDVGPGQLPCAGSELAGPGSAGAGTVRRSREGSDSGQWVPDESVPAMSATARCSAQLGVSRRAEPAPDAGELPGSESAVSVRFASGPGGSGPENAESGDAESGDSESGDAVPDHQKHVGHECAGTGLYPSASGRAELGAAARIVLRRGRSERAVVDPCRQARHRSGSGESARSHRCSQ